MTQQMRSQNRNTRRMARRARATARPREGAHTARRRARAAATRAALGAGGEGLPLRDRRRREDARRALRRTLATARLPLHVRTKLRGRLPGQLVDRRRGRRRAPAPARPRRDVRLRVAGTAGEAAGLQAANGLERSLGLVRAHRLQLRPRLLAHRGTRPRDRRADDRRPVRYRRSSSTTPARPAPTPSATSPRAPASARSSSTTEPSTTRTRRRGADWSS